MIKYILGALILIFGALAVIYFWIGVPKVYSEEFPDTPQPHLYNDLSQPIDNIKIAVFYFLPKNKPVPFSESWAKAIDDALTNLKDFHALQLQKTSQIDYEIYPEAIVGERENIEYDTEVTQFGNPEALKRIVLELERRVFAPSGDLFREDFAVGEIGVYKVLLIIYEGLGASGSDDAALISRIYLSDPQYEDFGDSILAHEFYHTLGIPDFYEIPDAIPTSQDIMGLGRFRPIERTYLSKEVIKSLGL